MPDSSDAVHEFVDERPDLKDSYRERNAIYAHIGEYVSVWALADHYLTMATSVWVNPLGGGSLQDWLVGQSTRERIDCLKAMLPKDWSDGQHLIRHLQEANTYRNTAAHHVLGMSGWDGETHFDWHFAKMSSSYRGHAIDVNNLDTQVLKARLLCSALIAIMSPPYFVVVGTPPIDQTDRQRFNDHSLRTAVYNRSDIWASRAQLARARSLLAEMFPKPKK